MLRMTFAPAAVLAVATLGPAAAFAAPAQLYGKSVVVTWSETREHKGAAQGSTVSRHGEFSAYVSSAGRVFNRLTYSGLVGAPRHYPRFQSGSSDRVNGEGSGQARSVAFSGHTMTSITLMDGGTAHPRDLRRRFFQLLRRSPHRQVRGSGQDRHARKQRGRARNPLSADRGGELQASGWQRIRQLGRWALGLGLMLQAQRCLCKEVDGPARNARHQKIFAPAFL